MMSVANAHRCGRFGIDLLIKLVREPAETSLQKLETETVLQRIRFLFLLQRNSGH